MVGLRDDAALRFATINGHVEVVRMLMANYPHAHDMAATALFDATRYGHTEVVGFLLSVGANMHVGADAPLRLVASLGHDNVVRALLAAGADPVAAWTAAPRHDQQDMAATLDACADAMTPSQRIVLANESDLFGRIRASLVSSERQCRLQR